MKVDLEKLRALPPHARTQISFFTAAGIAGVIALVWVTTLGSRFAEPAVVAEAPQKEEQKSESLDSGMSWHTVTEKIRDQIANVSAAWSSIRIETGSEEVEELETRAEAQQESVHRTETATTTATSTVQNAETPKVLIGTSTVKTAE